MMRLGASLLQLSAVTALALGGAGCSGTLLDPASSSGATHLQDPGYSLKDAQITETDQQGLPRYTVHAASAEQNPSTGAISLQSIRMQLRDQRGGEWHMRSDTGRMPEDASMVALRGAVVVDGNVGGAVQLRSEALDVDTRSEQVTTNAAVAITMSGRELDARGMHADLKERRVKLESDVHGRFTKP